MTTLFQHSYQNKKVLITGNTGFKGSWLAYWLQQLGATVIGYSLPAPTDPSHWQLLNLSVAHVPGDVRDKASLQLVFSLHQPDVVFHLAAQPLVRYSYANPLETLETNVMGTAHVLECVRQTPSVRAVVIVTSDKCYENPEDGHPLKETDAMGGYDPYSMSKGAAELVTSSYRNSYFNLAQYGQSHRVLVASVRAGNVIGGGDWATDRLLPDLIKGTASGKPVVIRNPAAVRPWQHVLEPLSGYLLVGQHLLAGNRAAAGGWNFGPLPDDVLPVQEVVRQAQAVWSEITYEDVPSAANPHEAHLLRLDCKKAHQQLDWQPLWNTHMAIQHTVDWYKHYYQAGRLATASDLETYVRQAQAANLIWTR